MDFLRENRLLDFTYGEKLFSELPCKVERKEAGNVLTTVYTLPDGLTVTNVATKYENAYHWINFWENTGDAPTEIISELWDAKVTLPLPYEEPLGWTPVLPDTEKMTKIYAPKGSVWGYDEFSDFPETISHNHYTGHLAPGESKAYSAYEGLSSGGQAPFFNVHKDGSGYIFAIGWTGQWHCKVSRTEDALSVQSKIEDTQFRILPGEKFRTASFVLMQYKGTVAESQNQWKRLVKKYFTPIGKPGRDAHGPLCLNAWGGTKAEITLQRIRDILSNEIPSDYIWMDAGWYGADTKPTETAYEGDWFDHAGQWEISPLIHPGQLQDISAAIHEAGRKFVLWFEPERAQRWAPVAKAHPEYFLFPEDEKNPDLLLNLGDETAWKYCFETMAGLVEKIGVDCFRQDFNVTALAYWQKKDTPERKGITEITYINGLYRFWDAMLEKFPHLLIDNCSGGGRRIDIESLRRSVPLWRSDLNCPKNFTVDETQCHAQGYGGWLPYSGTASGKFYDTYRFRSSYGPAMAVALPFVPWENFAEDPEKIAWLKKYLAEYIRARPYLSEDYYALTEVSDRKDIWCAHQYHRPEENDGILQVFRREHAPYETARYPLFALEEEASYGFTDADTGEKQIFTGKELMEQGFPVQITRKRSAKLYFYEKA